MFYNKSYVISDYLNYTDMNDLINKEVELINIFTTRKNLFNMMGYKTGSSCNSTINENELSQKNTGTYCRTNWRIENLEVGSKYTISCNFINSEESTVQIRIMDSNNSSIIKNNTTTTNTSGSITLTFTASTTTHWIRFYSNTTNTSNHKTVKFNNIQLEKGDIATPYEPYKEYILPIENYNLDLPTYELNDFPYIEEIDIIESNIAQLSYDFYQPEGYTQNKIWIEDSTQATYKSISAEDLNRMINNMNILYANKDNTPTIYNLYTHEEWDGSSSLEWEE